MLILTRRKGESIMIGDDIVVTVLAENRGQIRLGIAAPPRVTVNREEVHDRIKAEKRAVPA